MHAAYFIKTEIASEFLKQKTNYVLWRIYVFFVPESHIYFNIFVFWFMPWHQYVDNPGIYPQHFVDITDADIYMIMLELP